MTFQGVESTLAESFKNEAYDYLGTIRDETIRYSTWLEDVVSSLSQRERDRLYTAYRTGNLSEGAAHVLMGEEIYARDTAISVFQSVQQTPIASDTFVTKFN